MFALAINASPRTNSNTGILIGRVLQPLKDVGWETEVIKIGAKPMSGCIACMQCRKLKNNRCAITKDAFNDIYARMLEADAIILGTPTYFTDVTAEMKALIDRSGYVSGSNDGALAGKIGTAVIAVRRGGATHAFDTINHMFLKSNMVVPGSRYWNMGYGLLEGDVSVDAEGLANMTNLGEMINWLGGCLKPVMGSVPK
ncbi:MAG: flavodoxin family protein [Deltaproteobacteria bacterium]|nr:flavodoxin family protein [Deltaproteobacteria bacterium]